MVFDHLVVMLHPISYRQRVPNVKYEAAVPLLLGKAFSVCCLSTWETEGIAGGYRRLYQSDYVNHKQHMHISQSDLIHFRPFYLVINLI